ncbi:MAG: hypothetical protein IRZ28_07840 [Steroidobacteraceae bacterium]|nr:hypothetical protein [Steroidobacteraceae bacterium]
MQLGFRLARARNLDRVHGVDVAGEFPFEPVVEWAKRHGRAGEIDEMMATATAEVAHISELQRRTSTGGVLRDLNEPDRIARNHAFCPPLLRMGSGDDQPGAALLAAWYERNLAICARILQILQPGDKAVVFFGQNHIHLLRQCLIEQPGVDVVDALAYLDSGPA